MQNPFEAKAGNNSAVDALIGNAYEVVKYVAYYVSEIRYVALNMEHIFRASEVIYSNVFKTIPVTTLDLVYESPLPETISANMILGSVVTVLTADGEIHGPSDTTFSWKISEGKLIVTFAVGAPVNFVGSSIRWLINWQSPVIVTP